MARADPAHAADAPVPETVTLHRAIYQELAREVSEGVYGPGDRMPSEAALCERFGASRITVAKAIHALQRDGLVTRRPGSGTYVQAPSNVESYRFGLLIPQLGSTEIFEPICQGIMRAPAAKSHVLIWGHASGETEGDSMDQTAEQLCRQFIDQKASGVFFAPLEYMHDRDASNRRIVDMLAKANVPVVLLDRDFEPYPRRSKLDLVGTDNYRAGYVATRHLWDQGARRIMFVARKRSATTIIERIAGYQFAMAEVQASAVGVLQSGAPARVLLGDANDQAFIRRVVKDERPDGIVCGNDFTAARMMRSLLDLGLRIPESIKIVGFDDVSYAQFLPVPLTTIHQDCSELGRAALRLMLSRLREPDRAAWDVRVPFHLVVRQSCGAPPPSGERR